MKTFPKNIRQIGEPGTGRKILIEDYVDTYLRQLAEENLTCMKTAVLVGYPEEDTLYIQGAFEVDMGQEKERWFGNEHWRNIFEVLQEWFDGMEVVGWYLSNPGFPLTLTNEIKTIHERHFSGEQYVFLQMDILENEEIFYGKSEIGLAPLNGYYIYYEKNEAMQAYMSGQKKGMGIEPEGILADRAALRFRNVMQEKKEHNAQKKAMTFLYTACVFLTMVILVIGVTMVNNYDRMSSMENEIFRISENLDSTAPEENQNLESAVEEENRVAAEQTAESDQAEEVTEETPEDQTDQQEVPQETTEEASAPEEDAAQEVMSQAVQQPEQYTVREGDTLSRISRQKYGTDAMVKEICNANGLDNGDKIYAGQTIVLP